MRTSWAKTELDGAILVWIVEVHFPGQVGRFATHTINVKDGSASYHYPGSSLPMVFARKVDLFDGIPSTSEMGIAGYVGIDLPAMYAQGHRFPYIYAEVSQVRAQVHANGLEVLDSYNERRVLCAGRVRSPQWGRVMDDGNCYFAADIVTEWFASAQYIPADGHYVSEATWPDMARAVSDGGVHYPIVIGYPGYDPNSTFPVSAAPIAWLARQRWGSPTVAAGEGVLDATSMRMVHWENPEGVTVTLSRTYTPYGGSVTPSYDANGVLLTVVDYVANGYDSAGGNTLNDYYLVDTDDECDAFVAFNPTTGGGMLWRGRLLRNAGDVLSWALEQTGYRVDWGMTAVAAPHLEPFKIDTIISDRVKAAEWLQGSLLPLLPVSMMVGPSGVYPVVWRGDVGPDECMVINVDANNRIEVSDTVFDDSSETANRFTVEYGWDANARETRYRVRVGPGVGVAPVSDDYAYTLIDNDGDGTASATSRIRITAVSQGFAGTGITIDAAYAAGATSVVDSGTTVTIRIDQGGPDNAEAIAANINANSSLVRATPERDITSAVWGNPRSVSPAVSRTFLRDYGIYSDPKCEASRVLRRREAETGIVDAPTVSAPIVYDHTTARGIATWMAAAKAPIRTTVSVEVPDDAACGLLPLGPVLFSYAALGFSNRVGYAEEIEEHSDGRTSLRLVFLG